MVERWFYALRHRPSRDSEEEVIGKKDAQTKFLRKSKNGKMKTLDALIPDKSTLRKDYPKGAVCSIKDSPSRILRVAELGNLKEFEKLYNADHSRLKFKDNRGRNALHHAASKDKVKILEFIVEHGGDMNEQDNDGNTSLHIAVENEALETINYLLSNKALASLLNKEMKAAIHLAAELNKSHVLMEMIKYKDQVDTKMRGKHGRTALHIAAVYDHAECAKVLLSEATTCPRIACDNGYYPIHEAAKNASANTLKVMIDWGESIGCGREQMMRYYDADGNVPLHSAVHAGDIKAVKLCLESGAIISTQQHDLSTPVHLACAQGAIDIVKLMFAAQPTEKLHCLSVADAQQMTPLHCAAMFDHQDLVDYLIKEGSDIDAIDKEGRTSLLLAAARRAWNAVIKLIQLGAKITLQDKSKRNVLHHIVLSGGSMDHFCQSLCQRVTEIIPLLNERDRYGCTPMHYASKNGQLKTIQSLLLLGAVINLKNNENQSPLHFAARYGRYNTVRHLLESKKGHLIINEMDGEGMTPLHIASMNGHTRVVHLLLVKGALLHRDHKGRTPLHYAAMNGFTHTMDQLLAVHSHLLDQTCRGGNTALHGAAINNKANAVNLLLSLKCKIVPNTQDMTPIDFALHHKHNEVTMAMVIHESRNEEVMQFKTSKYSCLLEGLIAVMPEVMMEVLNRGITKSKFSEDSKSYFIKYNFGCLEEATQCSISGQHCPLPVMNMMVRYRREELLSHPLSVKYLEKKWKAYGMYFHVANLSIYTVFLAFVSCTGVSLMRFPENRTENLTELGHSELSYENSTGSSICSFVVLSFVVPNIIKEFYQMYQQRIKYFFDVINFLEWALYLTAGMMAMGILWKSVITPSGEHICAAIAVFLVWFNYLLYLQRFNRVGLYVVMFLEILSTLLRVMFVFSVLFIAFALSFYILLAKIGGIQDKGFHNPSVAIVRVGTMMLGEMDFLGTFLRPLRFPDNPTWHQMATATFFLVTFIILMPILLMNLLIGLAVGDIETVRRNAQLKRLTMQVELHTDLERKLPKKFLGLVDKSEIYDFPNRAGTTSYLINTVQRWFATPHPDSGRSRGRHVRSQELTVIPNSVNEELHRQRQRLKEVMKSSEQQLQLLRLIVQKMEIRTENGDGDEGCDMNQIIGFNQCLET